MCKKKRNFVADLDKKRVYHIIEWIVALTACGYLVYRLATFDDYPELWASLRAMSWRHYAALVLCVALMLVNMAIEAWRWRTLWNGNGLPVTDYGLSFREAHQQVYYSKLAGLVTPWRLGEYPARGLLMAKDDGTKGEGIWSRVLSMGAVGSATMTAAIVIAGIAAFGVLGYTGDLGSIGDLGTEYRWIVFAVLVGMVILAVGGWLVGSRNLALTVGSPSVDRRSTVGILCRSLGQSFVRLACWCVQLSLVLWALGALGELGHLGSLDSLDSIGLVGLVGRLFIYYLLVTVTPNVPIAEVGVRGAWAIVVFGTPNAAFAGVLLWVINTLLPCLIWPICRKNAK